MPQKSKSVENCRHVGIDKIGLLMEAAQYSADLRSIATSQLRLQRLAVGSQTCSLILGCSALRSQRHDRSA